MMDLKRKKMMVKLKFKNALGKSTNGFSKMRKFLYIL